MVTLIKLDNTDYGLYVNGQYVMAADAQFESVHTVEIAAENLAVALGVALQVIERDLPTAEDWSWADIREEIFGA